MGKPLSCNQNFFSFTCLSKNFQAGFESAACRVPALREEIFVLADLLKECRCSWREAREALLH